MMGFGSLVYSLLVGCALFAAAGVIARYEFLPVVASLCAIHATWLVLAVEEPAHDTASMRLFSAFVILYFPAVVGATGGTVLARTIRRRRRRDSPDSREQRRSVAGSSN